MYNVDPKPHVDKIFLNNKIPLICDEWLKWILCVQKPYNSWNFEHQKPLDRLTYQIIPPISDGWFLTIIKEEYKTIENNL